MKPKLFIFTIYFLLVLTHLLYSDNSFQWKIGEKLSYKVSWAFIRLGTVSLDVKNSTEIDKVKVHHIQFVIDSNPLVFFIRMHSTYDCYVDDQFRPMRYIASENVNNEYKKAVYNFNYSDSLCYIDFYDKQDSVITAQTTMPVNEVVFDGISLIFFARKQISNPGTKNVAAFIDNNIGRIELNFMGRGSKLKIDAVDWKMPTYFIKGESLMKGIAGVTGPYMGWFAQDNQRPPLKAAMKVFLGNVTVELESWENWAPPR
jgi:hypothetical protein